VAGQDGGGEPAPKQDAEEETGGHALFHREAEALQRGALEPAELGDGAA